MRSAKISFQWAMIGMINNTESPFEGDNGLLVQ